MGISFKVAQNCHWRMLVKRNVLKVTHCTVEKKTLQYREQQILNNVLVDENTDLENDDHVFGGIV